MEGEFKHLYGMAPIHIELHINMAEYMYRPCTMVMWPSNPPTMYGNHGPPTH